MSFLLRLSLSTLGPLLAVLFSGEAMAQEALIRTHLLSKEEPYVGQRTILIVELLAPGFFSGSPAFDLPDEGGLLLMPPSERPVVASENQNGVSYTVQRHEMAVFAEKPGAQIIPPLTVRFAFKRNPLDKETVPVAIKTEALHFRARTPPGAEKLGNVISARRLKVVETWKPVPGQAKAGDAFVRTIIYSAPDVPGMIFPPFPTPPIDGLGIYAKQPELLDRSERGEEEGERRDVFTYVCKRPGHFIVPGAQLVWWDLETQKLQTISFPARLFDVSLNPALPQAKGTPIPRSASKQGSHFLIGLTGLVATIGLLLLVMMIGFRLGIYKIMKPVHLVPLNPTGPK